MTKQEVLKQADAIRKEIEVLKQCDLQYVSANDLEILRQNDCVEGIALTGANSSEMYFEVYFIDGSIAAVTLRAEDWGNGR